MKPKIIVENKNHLQKLIFDEISLNRNKCDLNHIDVGSMTCMNYLFENSQFNGDISKWNVSKVSRMINMFRCSKFNQDLTFWKPYKLHIKYYMFDDCEAPHPYWYTAENTLKAIQSNDMSEKLNNDLVKNSLQKPSKIKI